MQNGGREEDIAISGQSRGMSVRSRVFLRRKNTAVGLCSTRDVLGDNSHVQQQERKTEALKPGEQGQGPGVRTPIKVLCADQGDLGGAGAGEWVIF